MSRKREKIAVQDVEFDMTPMIDVVFQLIIFFMLAVDMSQKDLEDLVPPVAKIAQKPNDEKRLIVNIVHLSREESGNCSIHFPPDEKEPDRDNPKVCTVNNFAHWRIKITKEDYTDSDNALIARLKAWADIAREPPKGGQKISKQILMIRGDYRAPYKIIEKIMRACGNPGVLIYKLEFGAMMPSEEGYVE